MTAFVMMPFASGFNDVHKIIQSCVREVDSGLPVLRLDEILAAGQITDDLVRSIRAATICIADVSGANPNVMWEVGYATALQKPTIAITQTTDNLPFDVRNVRMITYDRARLEETLRHQLVSAIRATLKAYAVPSTYVATHLNKSLVRRKIQTIGITGSMNARRDRATQKLDATLQPFLGRGIRWYVGSFGVIDETSVEFLLDNNEMITIVGYSTYDLSGHMREILTHNHRLEFIDATGESLEPDDGGKKERDEWLRHRSDLMIVVWNGQSEGTAELLDWLGTKKKDHIVCYVPPGGPDDLFADGPGAG
jgi:nucleoside 2-deoxyribosyltransferase